MKEITLAIFLGYILVIEAYWLLKRKNIVLSSIGSIGIAIWCLIYIIESQYNTDIILAAIWFFMFLIIKFVCVIYKEKKLDVLYITRIGIYFVIVAKLYRVY